MGGESPLLQGGCRSGWRRAKATSVSGVAQGPSGVWVFVRSQSCHRQWGLALRVCRAVKAAVSPCAGQPPPGRETSAAFQLSAPKQPRGKGCPQGRRAASVLPRCPGLGGWDAGGHLSTGTLPHPPSSAGATAGLFWRRWRGGLRRRQKSSAGGSFWAAMRCRQLGKVR